MTSLYAKAPGPQGLILLQADLKSEPRGRFSQSYSERDFASLGCASHYVQEHASRYALRHTVRGLHFQTAPRPQTKVGRVAQGRIHDVVVDIRRGSPTFGRHVALELAAGDWTQLHVPPGFAHGFCTLEPDTEVVFRLSDCNEPTLLRGLRWDDPALAIDWPCGETPACLFEVDATWPLLADLHAPF
jgi:dTDP-4-dehydrorhamnose 3,5-epimerase